MVMVVVVLVVWEGDVVVVVVAWEGDVVVGGEPGKRNSFVAAGALRATIAESTRRLDPRGLDRSARYTCCSPHTP